MSMTATADQKLIVRQLDAGFMIRVFLVLAAMLVVSLGIYVVGKHYGRTIAMAGHSDDTTAREIVMGNNVLHVPSNMIRNAWQRTDGSWPQLQLYARWPDMTGYSDANAAVFDTMEPGAPLLFLSIERRDMATDMSGRVATIYEKFFSGPPVEAGNGLVRRAFSSQSAYYMEDLYYEADSPYPFATRCIRENDRIAESICIRDIHVGRNLMVGYRFHASLLPYWREFDDAVRATIKGFVQ